MTNASNHICGKESLFPVKDDVLGHTLTIMGGSPLPSTRSTTTTHWIFYLFQTIFCSPKTWWFWKILIVLEIFTVTSLAPTTMQHSELRMSSLVPISVLALNCGVLSSLHLGELLP